MLKVLWEKIQFRMWRVKFHVAVWLASRQRRRLLRLPPEGLRVVLSPRRLPGVQVFSMCGVGSWPEQVLSVLSFLKHVGVPDAFTIVSDGTITPREWRLLEQLQPTVRLASWQDFITEENRAAVELYSQGGPMGKKLAVVTSLAGEGKSLYIDSDILFFPGAFKLWELLTSPVRQHYFLHNGMSFFVDSLLTAEEMALTPVCAGFLIQDGPIDWTEPLARLQRALETNGEELLSKSRSSHFLEQTVVHVAFNAARATALAGPYVMTYADLYRFRETAVLPADTVLRHYVSSIRHFMWPWAREYMR